MMRRERPEPGPRAIRAAFALHHERAGAAMARRWRLGEELASIAGCHHDFRANERHPRGAAFASFLHRAEAALAQESERSLIALGAAPEFDVMGVVREEAVAAIGEIARGRLARRDRQTAS